MINEMKYQVTPEDEKKLENANVGNTLFLNTSPNDFFDMQSANLNDNFYWDFIKKHPNLNYLQINNILDTGVDIIDQHVPFMYLLAEYENDNEYQYILALKFNPWHSTDENCFKISMTSSLKEAIELLEKESEYVYSNSFDTDITWQEIKEKLFIYDESKLLNQNLPESNIKNRNKL